MGRNKAVVPPLKAQHGPLLEVVQLERKVDGRLGQALAEVTHVRLVQHGKRAPLLLPAAAADRLAAAIGRASSRGRA